MLNERELKEWAIKGLNAEIDKLSDGVLKGMAIVSRMDRGEEVKTKKTRSEVLDIIQAKRIEIGRLGSIREEIRWGLDMEE